MPDIDKTRSKRPVLFTEASLEIIERVVPEYLEKIIARGGLIFGDHDHRMQLKRAAIAVLGEERGMKFARYDFRHRAAQETLDAPGGSPTATQAATRHASISTTFEYLKEKPVAAAVVLNTASAQRAALAQSRGLALSPGEAAAAPPLPPPDDRARARRDGGGKGPREATP